MATFQQLILDDNKPAIEELYLDYFNNFLTVARFAEYHNEPLTLAATVINKGRAINRQRATNKSKGV